MSALTGYIVGAWAVGAVIAFIILRAAHERMAWSLIGAALWPVLVVALGLCAVALCVLVLLTQIPPVSAAAERALDQWEG